METLQTLKSEEVKWHLASSVSEETFLKKMCDILRDFD